MEKPAAEEQTMANLSRHRGLPPHLALVLQLVAAAAIAGCASTRGTPAEPAFAVPGGGLDAGLRKAEATLEAERQRLHIPGLAFVVVRGDAEVLVKGLGERDVERHLPVTADTVFPIGSCTKAFTALAAAIAQDRGLLTLDDSPHLFLPDFHMADPEANALVTLRDMLAHRTGLRAYADLAAEPAVLTREEYLRAAVSARPAARLRERFQYSNAMYTAAGEIVASVYHASWEEAVTHSILEPAGMSSTVTSLDAAAGLPDHAKGYEWGEGAAAWTEAAPPASLRAMAPAGAIASSARDMARWLRMLLDRGMVDGTRVVSEGGLTEVTTPHIRVNDSFSYALGWATYAWNGHPVVEHNGGSTGLSAVMSFMPEHNLGFVILANTSPTSLTAIGSAGRLLWPLLTGEPERSAPGPGPQEEAAAAPAAAPGPGATVLPAASQLLARMVTAAGGERNLRRHTSLEARYAKRYENHGVESDLVVRAQAPDRREESEAWRAAGRAIATLRWWCDGARGAQETSFGQDQTWAAEELEQARRAAVFQPLLELQRLYPALAVTGTATVGDEEAYLLEASDRGRTREVLTVSARTGLVLRRQTDQETTTWSDFRMVDGEAVPHRATIEDSLGETTLELRSIRFNVPIPAVAFAPGPLQLEGPGSGVAVPSR